MRGRYAALVFLALGAGAAGGVALERFQLGAPGASGDAEPDILYWVAPMDPNFRRDGPGKSPMGMDLIPVYAGQEPTGDPETVSLSAAEINAIGVRTAVARLERVAQRIETVGFVGYDEHATSHVHMRVEGWIESLKVRAVGDRVAKGDLLFELYAPQITIASSELLRAMRRGDRTDIEIARRKLRNFGVTPEQIEEMARAELPAENIRVHAPRDGVVIAIEAAEGMFLKPDTRALSLSELSTVWVLVDVFERDLARLSEDMTAIARFEHLPGRTFEGRIDYIYPELDPETRTLPVRLRFDNPDGVLKPNMFANVALVPRSAREGITVPSEAVIRTGRAERVILRTGEGSFRPRLVTTGLRDGFGDGARTEIVQGLAPGEEVVASAQFLIDSESALNAGLLRMAPTEAAPAPGRGVLVALDPQRREALIRHKAIAALDWPEMETRFVIRADVAVDRLTSGAAVRFAAVRGVDGVLALTVLEPDDGIEATGTGVVRAVTPEGRVTVAHDPIPALGWPAMEMEMPVRGVDLAGLRPGARVSFDLARGEDGLFAIVGLRAEGSASDEPHAHATPEPSAAAAIVADERVSSLGAAAVVENLMQGAEARAGRPTRGGAEGRPIPIEVRGTVNSVQAETRTANVTHGPLVEIGMPGMTMDFPLGEGLSPGAIAAGREAVLVFERGPDFSLTLVSVGSEGRP